MVRPFATPLLLTLLPAPLLLLLVVAVVVNRKKRHDEYEARLSRHNRSRRTSCTCKKREREGKRVYML